MKRTLALAVLPLIVACDNGPKAANYSVMLDDAGGLKTGANVYIAGVQVGRVNQVELDGARARVRFDLRSAKGVAVTASTCVSVGWYGLGGDPHLSVDPGTMKTAQIAPGGEVSCVKESALGKSGEQAMASAEKLLATALSGKGLVSRLLHDKKLADKVERFFDQPAVAASAEPPTDPSQKAAPQTIGKPPKPPTKPRPVAPKPAPKKPPASGDLVNPFE